LGEKKYKIKTRPQDPNLNILEVNGLAERGPGVDGREDGLGQVAVAGSAKVGQKGVLEVVGASVSAGSLSHLGSILLNRFGRSLPIRPNLVKFVFNVETLKYSEIKDY
jgi:hypothetical protein